MSHITNFQFPNSVQADLFGYLDAHKREFIRPILRVLKKPAQEELCCALLDYLEQGDLIPPADTVLSGIFYYCVQHLEPLHRSEPKSIATILKQMFKPSL